MTMTWDRVFFLFLLSMVASSSHLEDSFNAEDHLDLDDSSISDPANVVNLYFQFLMSRQECGLVKVAPPTVQERIVGGERATPGEIPWMAILLYNEDIENKDMEQFTVSCAGSLLSERFVVTAAHCVDPVEPVAVQLGAHFVNRGFKNTQSYPIGNIVRHAHYTKNEMANDIALLELGTLVKFTDRIQPICLPLKQYWQNDFANEQAVVAGWGHYISGEKPLSSMVLNKLSVRVWPTSECTENLKLLNQQICAGGEKGKDSCNGDSGGPLIWRNNRTKRHYLIGLVSYGSENCGVGKPGIYTRVTKYLPWLIQHMD